jgi:hypothetical protein
MVVCLRRQVVATGVINRRRERQEQQVNTNHYTLEVDLRNDIDASVRSMAQLVDILCAALEERGFCEHDYYVEVKGPPELSFGVTMR